MYNSFDGWRFNMEDYRVDMGLRIQALRKERHLTQEEIAEALEVTSKHISEVERGIASLSMERFVKLAKLFDCSLDYLAFGKSIDGEDEYIPEIILETFRKDDEYEKGLLTDYLSLYRRLRSGHRE